MNFLCNSVAKKFNPAKDLHHALSLNLIFFPCFWILVEMSLTGGRSKILKVWSLNQVYSQAISNKNSKFRRNEKKTISSNLELAKGTWSFYICHPHALRAREKAYLKREKAPGKKSILQEVLSLDLLPSFRHTRLSATKTEFSKEPWCVVGNEK